MSKLPELSQIDLAKVESYERKNQNRNTVLSRISALRGREPWPRYDELTVAEIEAVLDEGDEQRSNAALEYERTHRNRARSDHSAKRPTPDHATLHPTSRDYGRQSQISLRASSSAIMRAMAAGSGRRVQE